QAGVENMISIDVGGTSADVAVAYGGHLHYAEETEIGGQVIKTPAIDIHTVGAGGGSIAWIDAGGALQVGPESAGADPGPACYGKGGRRPTLTDALVRLGVLDPRRDWITGRDWDLAALEQALDSLGQRFGWGTDATARAIFAVGVANVSLLLREEVVARGRDPRDYALLAIGGSGPMLAPLLAREQGIRHVIVPAAL